MDKQVLVIFPHFSAEHVKQFPNIKPVDKIWSMVLPF